MSTRSRRRAWVLRVGLAVSIVIACVLWMEAAKVRNVPVKAIFLSENLPGIAIPNKILNDKNGYYETSGGNSVLLNGTSGSLLFSVVGKSGRSVQLLFDSQIAPPTPPENLGDTCGVPYFLGGPVSTINWQFGTKNECVLSTTPDAEGYYEMTIKDNYLNLLSMQDGQVAYAYLQPMWFYVADSKTTARNDSRDRYSLDWEPNYVKIRAYDWDGTKVNSWSITPVTTKFKHMKSETANDPVPQYYLYDNGTIPRWLISNARRGCFHGIHNLPYELVITRL